MSSTASDSHQNTSLVTHPSLLTAFGVLVAQSFQRHWRVRQMGWVAFGLLGLVTAVIGVVTAAPAGWDLPGRRVPRTRITHTQYAEQLLPSHRYFMRDYRDDKARPLQLWEMPTPLSPTRDALQNLILSIPHVVLSSQKFLQEWGYMLFSRWVVLRVYLGFVLPLFILAYASAAFGTERESRSLVWLMTRPIPRWAIYLAKFLGTLPWCLLFGLGGFTVLCLAGGEYGRRALSHYWPAAAAGTVALAALFHLIGAVFRRPVVVGVVYVFFFELLVGLLPGSLKLLSLTFYARSLVYNSAMANGYPAEMLELQQPVSSTTAWAVLTAATVGLLGFGMWLFSRSEYRDDM